MSPRKYMIFRINCSMVDSGSPVSSSVSGTTGKTRSVIALDSVIIMKRFVPAGMKAGKAELKWAGSLAFGPDGILFVGDSIGGSIFAIDTEDRGAGQAVKVDIKGINEKIAAVLGTSADQILINDLAVNPISK